MLKDILAFLGAASLCLAVFVVVVYFWIRWKIRRVVHSMREQAKPDEQTPPFRILLFSAAPVSWEDGDAIEEHSLPLKRAGFFKIGEYRVDPTEVYLQAWRQPREAMYGVVYEHPEAGVWVDLVTIYDNGEVFSASSARDDLLDRPPHKTAIFYEGVDADQLHSDCLKDRPQHAMQPATADAFTATFEQAWAEEMDWRISRGGPTAEELERIAQRDDLETDEAIVQAVREKWRSAINEFYEERLREQFLNHCDLSAAQWEHVRDRVVFVHDRLSEDDLADLYGLGIEYDEDSDEYDSAIDQAYDLMGDLDPRQAFSKLNQQLPHHRQFEKLGDVNSPLPADVYQSPVELE